MSRKALVWCLALAMIGSNGCFKQHCTNPADLTCVEALCITPHQGYDPNATLPPPPGNVPPPTTVDETQREPWNMTLREAIAIALEQGRVGSLNPLVPGTVSDVPGGFLGTGIGGVDAIRVLALDPAIMATTMEISLARFDAIWNTSAAWNHTENPIGTNPNPFGGNIPGPVNLGTLKINTINVSTGVLKPLPTGGVAGITFRTDYLDSQPPSLQGQNYQPNLQFSFEQPLLQGFGVEINQLREVHPGSLLSPFSTGGQVAGILITRLRTEQQRAEFERNVNFLLLNVEAAYWNLYGAYFQLFSREEAMRYAYETWRLSKLRLQEGRAAEQELAQARVQYERFRFQRLQALGQVLENERQLRGLLGLKIEDGKRIVPIDTPTLTPVKPDWQTALNEALAQRPELVLARQELRIRQLNLVKEKNLLLPDLRFLATTDLHSIGGNLEGGPNPNNAFSQLMRDPFVNWSFGLRMNVPIGFRAANANVRAARLGLERSYLSLRTEEDMTERFLGLAYRNVIQFQEQIHISRATFRAATQQLEKYNFLIKEGRATIDANLVLALRDWSDSLTDLYSAIVSYNNALATLEFAKGTIMEHDGVQIADGPLPYCAEKRAVEHERERSRALLLKNLSRRPDLQEGPRDCLAPGCLNIPADEAVPLPTLQDKFFKLPEELEPMKKVKGPPPTLNQTYPSTPALMPE